MNATPTDDTGATGLGLALDAAGSQYVAGALQSGGGAPAVRTFGSITLTGAGGYGSGRYS